jgi:hypothetical protein
MKYAARPTLTEELYLIHFGPFDKGECPTPRIKSSCHPERMRGVSCGFEPDCSDPQGFSQALPGTGRQDRCAPGASVTPGVYPDCPIGRVEGSFIL